MLEDSCADEVLPSSLQHLSQVDDLNDPCCCACEKADGHMQPQRQTLKLLYTQLALPLRANESQAAK